MHPNERTLETFYSAFARLDPDTMAPCYASDASFGDDAFALRGHDLVTGTPILLPGWTPFLRSKVRRTAAANLHTYLARRRQGGH